MNEWEKNNLLVVEHSSKGDEQHCLIIRSTRTSLMISNGRKGEKVIPMGKWENNKSVLIHLIIMGEYISLLWEMSDVLHLPFFFTLLSLHLQRLHGTNTIIDGD
jgi:hypothetical protein